MLPKFSLTQSFSLICALLKQKHPKSVCTSATGTLFPIYNIIMATRLFMFENAGSSTTSTYNLSTSQTSLTIIDASPGDDTVLMLYEHIKECLKRLLTMYPSLRTKKIAFSSCCCPFTGNSSNKLIIRQCIIPVANWGTYRTKSGTTTSYNVDYTPLFGRFDVNLGTIASGTTALHATTTAATLAELDAIDITSGVSASFSIVGLTSAQNEQVSSTTMCNVMYDPSYTGAEVSYIPQASKISYGKSYKLGKVAYTEPVITNVIGEDSTVNVYPLKEYLTDVDTEEGVYDRISKGDSIKEIAMQNPSKFLVQGENYIMYYGYIKTGFYS